MTRLPWRLPLLIVLGCVSAAMYELLDTVVPRLALAEPSGAWQLVPWSVRSASRADIPTDISGISGAAAWFTLVIGALFLCYLAALVLIGHAPRRSVTVAVFTIGVIFQVQQLDAPALLSSDPFSYLMYGRIASIHHGNPYHDTPSTYVDDPVLPYVYWRDVPSFYGPLWTEVSAVIASIAAESIPRGVLLFRSVAAASALACGGLIWLVLRDRGAQTATAGAALWLWNPLVPLEAGMSGHNDLLLMLFLLAAVWAAQQQKIVLSGACWASAFFIKAIAALMLPIVGLIWLVGGKGPQALGKSGGLAIVGVLIVMLGLFVAGRSPLEGSGVGVLGADTVRYTNSVHELILAEARVLMGEMPDDVRAPLYFHTWPTQLSQPTGLWSSSGSVRQLIASLPDGASLLVVAPAENEWTRVFEPSTGRVGYVPSIRLLDEVMPGEIEVMNADSARAAWTSRSHLADANTLIRASAYAAFAVGFLVIALEVLKRGGGAWATAFTSLFLVFLLATATWIWSWYILWPLGFAAFSPSTRAVRLTLILSASSLLIYPLFSYQGTDMWWAFNFRSAVVWVFPVIAWWVSERMLESRNRHSVIPLGTLGEDPWHPSAQGLPGGARKGTPLRSA